MLAGKGKAPANHTTIVYLSMAMLCAETHSHKAASWTRSNRLLLKQNTKSNVKKHPKQKVFSNSIKRKPMRLNAIQRRRHQNAMHQIGSSVCNSTTISRSNALIIAIDMHISILYLDVVCRISRKLTITSTRQGIFDDLYRCAFTYVCIEMALCWSSRRTHKHS